MSTNQKALELVEKGLSAKTVSKLSENQLNLLHKKMVQEQITTSTKQVRTTKIPANVAKTTGGVVDGVSVKVDSGGNVIATQTEQNDIDDMSMDAAASEFMEADKDLNNPWAICTKSVGRSNKKKYERCVKDVKRSLKEGKNPVSLFIETKIMDLVEKHIPPKMTKGELLGYILEDDTKIAPSKPTTKPKPGTKEPTKPKPKHPGKNPSPGTNPAPKAKKVSAEDAKDEVIDLIINLLEK